jgi:protein MpaA
METFEFGTTSTGLPILGYRFGRGGPEVLLLGGVHGNEPEGVIGAYGLLQTFMPSYTLKVRLTVVPEFNLDGVLAGRRSIFPVEKPIRNQKTRL